MRDTILYGDCRETLGTLKAQISIGIAERPRMCVTSPPYYGLRDYGGQDNQIGLEQSPEGYVTKDGSWAAVPMIGSETKLVIIHNGEHVHVARNYDAAKTYILREKKKK